MPAVGFGMYNTDAKSAFQAVSEALEAGVRSIDTAAAYGNEKEVGMGWKASGLTRSDLTLSSKLSNMDLRDGNVKQAVERSLRLLQTDYLDAYYIHSPLASPAQREKAWKEMHMLKSQGLIRACGLSNFGVEKIKLLTDNTRLPPPALIQVFICMCVCVCVCMYVRTTYVCAYVCI
jgi:diketogulonate reductase-like aldo/keto reductase